MFVNRHWLLIYLIFLFPLMGEASSTLKNKHENLTPILFVHGHGLYAEDWDYLIKYFVEHSYPREYLHALSIKPNTQQNITAAQDDIRPAVDRLLKATGSRKVNIVSHSMGAVSARWYASKIAPEKVNGWLSIAGSNHGTNALCAYNDEAAKEMCPAFSNNAIKNGIQVKLNGNVRVSVDETPYGFGRDRKGVNRITPDENRGIHYSTLRIAVDEWIRPSNSAILDGTTSVSDKYKLPSYLVETSPGNYLFDDKRGLSRRADHCSLLKNKKIAKFVFDLFNNVNLTQKP